MKEWTLTAKGAQRFRSGHPWAFSNELSHSPKALVPGELVSLKDPHGERLAFGYGNPHSLIAFRALTRSRRPEFQPTSFIEDRLVAAARLRGRLGYTHASFRLCFAEADSLPGLVIDFYLLDTKSQVLAVQILTAGMEELFYKDALPILQGVVTKAYQEGSLPYDWNATAVVVKRDSKSRQLENLLLFEPAVLKELPDLDLSACRILVRHGDGTEKRLTFLVDLVGGQKTGFFLDQHSNIALAMGQQTRLGGQVKILDLFCYVGHWSTQLAASLAARGATVDVTAIDASKKALAQAAANLKPYCRNVVTSDLDLIKSANELPVNEFDVVICDPPALIKAKKDFHQGRQAYVKINAAALRSVKPGGFFISSSCSQHLSEEDLLGVINKAEGKAEKRLVLTARGLQAPDHPVLSGFPQGLYLKAWMGVVDEV